MEVTARKSCAVEDGHNSERSRAFPHDSRETSGGSDADGFTPPWDVH